MIKILHSELDSCIGGIETFLLNLARCIDKENIQLEFITKRDNPAFEEEFKKYGCVIHKVPSDVLGYCQTVKNILKNNDYSFVHIHKNSAADIVLPVFAKLYSKAHIIVHSHNTQPSKNNLLLKILHRVNRGVLTKIADSHFACSELAAEWLYGDRFVKKNNVEIIKNGIILKNYVFNEALREEVRAEVDVKDRFVIGHVGRFTPQKNHRFLIDIIKELDENYLMLLVGNGQLYDDLKAYAEKSDVGGRVRFLGERTDVSRIMQAMDAFLLPSLWEGLPVTCVEAQASGLPVILSDRISHMCSITDNVKYMPIDSSSKWCEELKRIKTSFVRGDESERIIASGFDMQSTADYYTNLLRDYLRV